MRNVEGGGTKKHSRSVSLAAGVYCSTQRSRARTQYKPQSRSRVLRIRAARTWVNCSCASPRSALRAISAPAEPKGAWSAGPHRCSWISFPDISYHDCFEKVLSSEIYYYCSLVDYAIDMSNHET